MIIGKRIITVIIAILVVIVVLVTLVRMKSINNEEQTKVSNQGARIPILVAITAIVTRVLRAVLYVITVGVNIIMMLMDGQNVRM